MANLKYKHTAYTSAEWASLNPVIVENEIVIESDTKRTKIGNGISTYNQLEYADANSIGNSLGSIKPTDAAPTPARNGNYTFSIGGNKPAWLTAEAGVTTVKAGDGVAVVYAAPSSYTYTHVDAGSSIEQARSQSTSKVPSSKLMDDELNRQELYNITVRMPLTAGQFYTATTARAAVPANIRKLGLKITYATAAGVWVEEQFVGGSVSDWGVVENWENVTKKIGDDFMKMNLFRQSGNLVNPNTLFSRTNGNVFPTSVFANPSTNPSWYYTMSSAISVLPNAKLKASPSAYHTAIAEYDFDGQFIKTTRNILLDIVTLTSNTYYIRYECVFDLQYKGVWYLEDYNHFSEPFSNSKKIITEISLSSINFLSNKILIPAFNYFLKSKDEFITKDSIVANYNLPFNNLRTTIATNYRNSVKFNRNSNFAETFTLFDANGKISDTKTCNFIGSDLTINNGALNWLPIGDSYTDPSYYVKSLQTIDNEFYCPSLTSVGIKKGHQANGGGDWNLGLSGWSLFSTSPSKGNFRNTIYSPNYIGAWAGFSPLVHVSNKRYYGCSKFWKTIYIDNAYTYLETFEKFGFNPTTGLRDGNVNYPLLIGDLMWNFDLQTFVEWDGINWVNSMVVAADFNFNVSKFREVWDIPNVNLFSIMIGINDFGSDHGSFSFNYINYKNAMDELIQSMKADNTNAKIGIFIPPITYGKNGTENNFNRNLTMSLLKSALIRDYDNRTTENIYLVDVCNSIEDKAFGDVVAGGAFTSSVKVSELSTTNIQIDTTHPNLGYNLITKKVAAFIQAIR